MESHQYASILSFLAVALSAMVLGVPFAYALCRRLAGLPGAIAGVFVLSMILGVLAARAMHFDPRRQQDVLNFLILIACFGNIAPPLWKLWTARGDTGSLLHALPRPGDRELVWSGRAIMFMASLFFVLYEPLALRIAWLEAAYVGIFSLMAGSLGRHIGESLGRVSFCTAGVVSGGVLYPWPELGKFEWMPGGPPVLRIQVRGRYARSDIRIACPDVPEISGILTAHGLTRW